MSRRAAQANSAGLGPVALEQRQYPVITLLVSSIAPVFSFSDFCLFGWDSCVSGEAASHTQEAALGTWGTVLSGDDEAGLSPPLKA
jgi:hypothetical protein